MRIGMEFRDNTVSNIDFSHVELGNPGCGGTQFEFALLAHHLLKMDKGYEIIFFHFSKSNTFERGIKEIIIDDTNDIPEAATNAKVDVLLFWSTHDDEWYNKINEYKLKSIAWSHNFLSYDEIRRIENCKFVKKVVSVSKEQYELLAGETIFDRCTYIFNMFDFVEESFSRDEALKENIVCCVGTLIKAKGFHILAKEWKAIIKDIPSAKLYVMGNGKLWNKNAQMGKYDLAESRYEKSFMKYLTDKEGNILSSVYFLGNVGVEKKDIFRKCKVGVVNPTGVETFCISAIEMEAEGVPVCSKMKNGLIDTISNSKTGFLSRTSYGLRRNIIRLLKDDELNICFGNNAKRYAHNFSGNILVNEWDRVFCEVVNEIENVTKPIFSFQIRRLKFLRQLVGRLRRYKLFRIIPTPYAITHGVNLLKGTAAKLRNMLLRKY